MKIIKYGNSTIRPSIPEDIEFLSDKIRASDLEEIRATSGRDVKEVLKFGFEQSTICLTALAGDMPYCMFGLDRSPNVEAGIWLLGTDYISKIPKTFLNLSFKVISYFHEINPILFNFVDFRNRPSIRWLSRCGAEFSKPIAYGVSQKPFTKFILKKESALCAAQRI